MISSLQFREFLNTAMRVSNTVETVEVRGASGGQLIARYVHYLLWVCLVLVTRELPAPTLTLPLDVAEYWGNHGATSCLGCELWGFIRPLLAARREKNESGLAMSRAGVSISTTLPLSSTITLFTHTHTHSYFYHV